MNDKDIRYKIYAVMDIPPDYSIEEISEGVREFGDLTVLSISLVDGERDTFPKDLDADFEQFAKEKFELEPDNEEIK